MSHAQFRKSSTLNPTPEITNTMKHKFYKMFVKT